jgi:outer membrane protein OmpA-like peptidoglycan-associated protein
MALDRAERAYSANEPIARDDAIIALQKTKLAEMAAQKQAKTQEERAREEESRVVEANPATEAVTDLHRIAGMKQEARGMVLTLPGSLFGSGESALAPGAVLTLKAVAEALEHGSPDVTVTIEGHTDARGSHAENTAVSRRRAEAVKAQLVSDGVAADRIKAVGVGPDRPIADNSSEEGRANNRRVEIIAAGQQPSSTTPPGMTSPMR